MASRPYWSGFLRFSLVTVPVKLYSATTTSSEKIALNQLHATCHSRVVYKKTCPQHGELKSDETVTGYEFDEGKYVIVDTSEVEKLRQLPSKANSCATLSQAMLSNAGAPRRNNVRPIGGRPTAGARMKRYLRGRSAASAGYAAVPAALSRRCNSTHVCAPDAGGVRAR